MSQSRLYKLGFLVFGLLAGCSAPTEEVAAESEESFEGDALTVGEPVDGGDKVASRLSELFLVEHSKVAFSPGMAKMMGSAPPGGLVFWNLGKGTVMDLRETVRGYEAARANAGKPAILYSTDYEGGGSSYTTRGTSNPGVQRFISNMTALAHPRWIGLAYRKNRAAGEELAYLHGKIMGEELRSVGINYPLATVSDLAEALFVNRAIDTDPANVSRLMGKVLEGYRTVPGGVFVTKHFPGLGQTRGDTHDTIVVSQISDMEGAEKHLQPFRKAVEASEGSPFSLSVLCGHAKYPLFDAVQQTTVSEPIVTGLLRDDLKFQGLALSDAMWMGPYGTMPTSSVLRVYVHSTLAGMDMLMIPGLKYGAALSYYRKVYNGSLGADERAALSAEVGLAWPELQAKFKERAAQSQVRMDATREVMADVRSGLLSAGVRPSAISSEERTRYRELLSQVDAAWNAKSL